MYYSYVVKLDGYCLRENECEKGCVSIYKPQSCPEGMFWANNETCVARQDCMCISYAGIPVKVREMKSINSHLISCVFLAWRCC